MSNSSSEMENIQIDLSGSRQCKEHPNTCRSNSLEIIERQVSFGEDYLQISSSSSSYPSEDPHQVLSAEATCASLYSIPPAPPCSYNLGQARVTRNKEEKNWSIATMEKMKRLLQVESDEESDSCKQDAKNKEEKTRIVQEMINTTVGTGNTKKLTIWG